MSQRRSDRSTLPDANIKKQFTTKARNEPQESEDEEKPEGGAVNEMITETEEPSPSAFVSKKTTNALAESPNANIKSPTGPNQNVMNCTEKGENFAFEWL